MTNRFTTNLTSKVIVAKQRRLAELEEQQAILGINTPPHVVTEIEDIQSELALADVLDRPSFSPEMRAKLKSFDEIELLGKFIGAHAVQLTGIAKWQEERDTAVKLDDEKRDIRQRKIDFVFGALIIAASVNFIMMIVLLVIVINALGHSLGR